MTAKDWLGRARKMSSRLRALQHSKRRAYSRATNSTTGAAERISGGEPIDKHVAFADVSLAVDRQKAELEQIRAEILEVIGQVEDNTQATILTEYYLNDLNWEKIAIDQHYSLRQIMRLRVKALQRVQEILDRK